MIVAVMVVLIMVVVMIVFVRFIYLRFDFGLQLFQILDEFFTTQLSVDCRPSLSVTVTWKVRLAPFAPTFGASKMGLTAAGSERVTEIAGIAPVCFHI
jgi:hypothetical protein